MKEAKLKIGIECVKLEPKGMLAFGISLFHWEEETYLCINFFKWTISMGRFYH